MLNKIRTEKEDLVERLGVFMEKKEQFAPLAARILSYIVLTGKVGTTFEDLVRDLCASKSTISTHLNQLASLKRILYYTKTGDRKKYYIINEDTFIQSIDDMMETWIVQKELHLEIKAYKNKINDQNIDGSSKLQLDFHDNYIQFLEEVTKSVATLKLNIIKNTKNQ